MAGLLGAANGRRVPSAVSGNSQRYWTTGQPMAPRRLPSFNSDKGHRHEYRAECTCNHQGFRPHPPWRRLASAGPVIKPPHHDSGGELLPQPAQWMGMSEPREPIVHFYRLITEARLPQCADRSAAGTLPTRAYRYCAAAANAAGCGWWIFPPTDLRLFWDGHDIYWQPGSADEWLPLQPSAQFPGFASCFDAAAPASLAGSAPPFLSALPEPGTLQVWTGLMARTAPDWSLLLRAPANLPLPGGYVLYEGIVETDHWFGPLFTNLRFTRSHAPVRLRPDFPFLLAQPVPRLAYADVTLASMSTSDEMGATDWADYEATVARPNADPERPFGAYAVGVRKRMRGRCPLTRQA